MQIYFSKESFNVVIRGVERGIINRKRLKKVSLSQ